MVAGVLASLAAWFKVILSSEVVLFVQPLCKAGDAKVMV
jgi:hypothetical protein